MQYQALSNIERWKTATGEVVLARSQTSVFCYQVSGYFTVEMARVLFDRFDEFAKKFAPPYVAFVDFSALQSYDREVRVEATKWFKARQESISLYHVLVHSKVASMGLATLSLLSGLRIRSYSDAGGFERERAKALGVGTTSARIVG